MELSEVQRNVVNAPDGKILVISSAASGKTRTMTEKVRKLLQDGVSPKQIAVITFTNMAAAELRQRLGDDYKTGLFVGTIHALANYMLLSHGIKTGKVLDEEKFDDLFKMVSDNPQCIEHYKWILLDEAQDTDALQFKFILEMIKPECFAFFGDPKQSIYQFRGARPDLLLRLAHMPGVKVFDLYENYRNGINILNYAKRLIRPTGLEDASVSRYHRNGTVTELVYNSEFIINKIMTVDEYRDWAILTRTNREISDMSYILSRKGIPFETFKQGDLTREDLIEKMQADTVKILTVHSAKGLEWNNVIVMGMRFKPADERNVCYVAATRARNNLFWITKKHY